MGVVHNWCSATLTRLLRQPGKLPWMLLAESVRLHVSLLAAARAARYRLEPHSELKGALERFFGPKRDENVQYIGLCLVESVANFDPKLVQGFVPRVIRALDEFDITVRTRALRVVCALVTAQTVQTVVNKLVARLDPRTQLLRIARLLEQAAAQETDADPDAGAAAGAGAGAAAAGHRPERLREAYAASVLSAQDLSRERVYRELLVRRCVSCFTRRKRALLAHEGMGAYYSELLSLTLAPASLGTEARHTLFHRGLAPADALHDLSRTQLDQFMAVLVAADTALCAAEPGGEAAAAPLWLAPSPAGMYANAALFTDRMLGVPALGALTQFHPAHERQAAAAGVGRVELSPGPVTGPDDASLLSGSLSPGPGAGGGVAEPAPLPMAAALVTSGHGARLVDRARLGPTLEAVLDSDALFGSTLLRLGGVLAQELLVCMLQDDDEQPVLLQCLFQLLATGHLLEAALATTPASLVSRSPLAILDTFSVWYNVHAEMDVVLSQIHDPVELALGKVLGRLRAAAVHPVVGTAGALARVRRSQGAGPDPGGRRGMARDGTRRPCAAAQSGTRRGACCGCAGQRVGFLGPADARGRGPCAAGGGRAAGADDGPAAGDCGAERSAAGRAVPCGARGWARAAGGPGLWRGERGAPGRRGRPRLCQAGGARGRRGGRRGRRGSELRDVWAGRSGRDDAAAVARRAPGRGPAGAGERPGPAALGRHVAAARGGALGRGRVRVGVRL